MRRHIHRTQLINEVFCIVIVQERPENHREALKQEPSARPGFSPHIRYRSSGLCLVVSPARWLETARTSSTKAFGITMPDLSNPLARTAKQMPKVPAATRATRLKPSRIKNPAREARRRTVRAIQKGCGKRNETRDKGMMVPVG
jgi:hypothetical protein